MNMKKILHLTLSILLLSLLCSCFMYEERGYDNPYDPTHNEDGVRLQTGTIQIDADTSDWEAIPAIRTDNYNEGNDAGNPYLGGDDLFELKMVEDDENIYFYISTYNPSPLLFPGMNLHTNFETENDSFQFFNISHNNENAIEDQISAGSFGLWSNYSYATDDDNSESIGIENPPIRFAGIDQNYNSLELGISKTLYWDISEETVREFSMGIWSSYYDYLYNDGGIDDINDLNELSVIVKSAEDPAPNSDIPLLQFDNPSSALTIDGNNSDLGIWEETGVWYQDFVGDDKNILESNTDIDKIYIKQDQEYVYMLLIFADPGTFNTGTAISYDIGVSATDSSLNHTFNATSDGASWTGVNVQYDVSIDASGCIASSSIDGYLELQFDKTIIWDMMPIISWQFNINARDSVSSQTDSIQFAGSHKSSQDASPDGL